MQRDEEEEGEGERGGGKRERKETEEQGKGKGRKRREKPLFQCRKLLYPRKELRRQQNTTQQGCFVNTMSLQKVILGLPIYGNFRDTNLWMIK